MTAQKAKPQKQPHSHAPKSRVAAIQRRTHIIQALVDGKNLTTAGIQTGLSPKTASSQVSKILNEPQTQVTFHQLMDRAGLSDEVIAARIKELSFAKETKFFSDKGIVTDSREVEALSIQADMTKFAAKVKGHVVDRVQSTAGDHTYIDLSSYQVTLQVEGKQEDDPDNGGVTDV